MGRDVSYFFLQYQQHMTIITWKIYPQFNISYHLSQARGPKEEISLGEMVEEFK